MATEERVLEPITRLQLCSLISGLREASVGTPVFRILNEDGSIRWEWSFEDSNDPRAECVQELNRCNDEAPSLKLTMVEAVVQNRAEKMCEQAASLLTRFMDQMICDSFLVGLAMCREIISDAKKLESEDTSGPMIKFWPVRESAFENTDGYQTCQMFLTRLEMAVNQSLIPNEMALYFASGFSLYDGVFFNHQQKPVGIAMRALLQHFEAMKRERSNGDQTKNGARTSPENSGGEADEGNGLRYHSAGL